MYELNHVNANQEREDMNETKQTKDEDSVQALKKELKTKNDKIKALEKEIEVKDRKISSQERDIEFLERRLDSAYGEVNDKDRDLARKDRDLGLKDKELAAKDERIETLKLQLAEARKAQRTHTSPTVVSRHIIIGGNQLQWKKAPKLPKPVSAGSACILGDKGYVYCSTGEVFEFDTKKEIWTTLPPCPLKNSTIVTVIGDFKLTAVGGINQANQETNMLVSWIKDRSKWIYNFYLPMPTKRYRASAVCDDKNLIVVGGCCGQEKLSVVELLHLENEEWYVCRSLPHPLGGGSLVTMGTDSIYIVGGSARDAFQRLFMLRCSLDELWKTSQRHTVQNMTMQLASKKKSPSIWHKATELPVQHATCTLIRNKLYIIGGEGTDGKHSSSIYVYNHETNSLESVGHLLVGRSWSQVMVFPGNKIVVVGGETDSGASDEVELAAQGNV